MAAYPCDNTAVGVLVRAGNRYLVFDREGWPPGVAPISAHVDARGHWDAAARDQVAQDTGLTVTTLRRLDSGWRDNRCARMPGGLGQGHAWRIFEATVTGTVRPSAAEINNARWVTGAELQALSARTIAYANGLLTATEFSGAPGIDPAWVHWLDTLGVITVDAIDLAVIDRLADGTP